MVSMAVNRLRKYFLKRFKGARTDIVEIFPQKLVERRVWALSGRSAGSDRDLC
jgi:hypothetical protein